MFSVAICGCHSVTRVTSADSAESKLGPVYGNPALGDASAPVKIVIFEDLTCGMCRYAYQNLVVPLQNTPEFQSGQFKIIFAEYPLGMMSDATKAARALKCADEQDKYFEAQSHLYSSPETNKSVDLLAKQVGLDAAAFQSCLTSNRSIDSVRKDFAVGRLVGVNGTPAIYINSKHVGGAQEFATFWESLRPELTASR